MLNCSPFSESPNTLYTYTANMTSAHIAPHVENLSNTISQFHGHIESDHEDPHGVSVPIVQPLQY